MSVMAEKLCPHGRVSFECRGLSSKKGVSGRHWSLDSEMESRVSGHSSSGAGMESLTSMLCLSGRPLLLNVSLDALEKSLKLNGVVFAAGSGIFDVDGIVDVDGFATLAGFATFAGVVDEASLSRRARLGIGPTNATIGAVAVVTPATSMW